MDRGCITYSIAFMAGIFAGHAYAPCFIYTAIFTAILLAATFITRKNAIMFLAASHLALFMAGTGAMGLAMERVALPPDKFSSAITDKGEAIRREAGLKLAEISSTEENYAILGALTVGIKGNMDREMKNSWSSAGAMHLLAISGLHVGIIYSIFETLSIPIGFIPGGGSIRWMLSMVLLFCYMFITGCSPSVTRACVMIFIYKLARHRFRNTRNWDAIALSALITCTLAPLQATSLGFQLSYAAVIGIAALYPTCRSAFIICASRWNIPQGLPYKAALKLWESISISVCCQIATLPLLIVHFGESAQFFILTNLLAIPLVTIILYLLVITVALHWLPVAQMLLTEILNCCVSLLNSWIYFISH